MKNVLLFLLVLFAIAAIGLWLRHGGGNPYPDLTNTPRLGADVLEEVVAYSEPIGNVAVSSSGRVFFTVHPEARPKGNKLLEYVDGAAVPYPSLRQQSELFSTPLGVVIDRFDRLWVIDHGNHGTGTAAIVAIDIASGEVLRQQALGDAIAPTGSFLQDLQVSHDGKTIVIADASFWRKSPALIVYDVETGAARRVLENDASVAAEDFKIRTADKTMEFLGGIVALRGGVDGLAMGREWLYFGALSGSGLYRIRLRDLRDESLPAAQLANRVEHFSEKPLSDGMSIGPGGNVFVTGIEHNAIFVVTPQRELQTLVQSRSIRWPDALSFGPDGYMYVADSALQELILQPAEHITANGPYRIFRFPTGVNGIAGQ